MLKADAVRLITLTMPATPDDLERVMSRLFDAFGRLRRLAGWKRHVKGGLFVCEITRGQHGQHWHAHLHVLAEGSYYDQKALAADWAIALGSKAVVDVRAVHGRLKAANYVTKYVTKGAETACWDDDTICDFARGVHRRRMYGTFGSWHRADVNRDDDDDDAKAPQHGVSLKLICDAVHRGTLDPEVYVPLIARLGFVAARMLSPLVYTPPEVEPPSSAELYEQLTLFGLELIDAPPPPPPTPPPDRDHGRFTLPLFRPLPV